MNSVIRFFAFAVASLAGSVAAASYTYTLEAKPYTVCETLGDQVGPCYEYTYEGTIFILTVPSFLTADTSFTPEDFDLLEYGSAAPYPLSDIDFIYMNTMPLISFRSYSMELSGYRFGTPFSAPGAYCATLTSSCENAPAILTISEVADVSEPGSLALLGLGLAGIAALRRRRA